MLQPSEASNGRGSRGRRAGPAAAPGAMFPFCIQHRLLPSFPSHGYRRSSRSLVHGSSTPLRSRLQAIRIGDGKDNT
ncbi:unnamed protein product [Urochloa humidicola]